MKLHQSFSKQFKQRKLQYHLPSHDHRPPSFCSISQPTPKINRPMLAKFEAKIAVFQVDDQAVASPQKG
ncbi:MAG: hypothetical protein ACRENG_02055 [bacterium]